MTATDSYIIIYKFIIHNKEFANNLLASKTYLHNT